jgi:putative LysE/RhtB family amino acid efflux pump
VTSAFTAGFGLGFVVAAQVGPIWVLCARSVLRGRAVIGISIGAGAAVIDALYAGLGVAGASALLEISGVRVGLGLLGAGFLAFLGLRTLWSAFRIRLGGETDEEVSTPWRAFLTSLVATASNPMTIASWAAVFTAASTADLVQSGWSAAALVAGVATGTFTWFTALSVSLSFARGRGGARLLSVVDVASGLVLLGFAGLLAVRTLDDAA